MKVLISVWGDPERWDDVNYEYSGKSKRSKDAIDLVREVERPDKVVIICVDTLADNHIYSYEALYSNPYYPDIKSIAESVIKNFCQNQFGFEPDKVIVGYGVGEFEKTIFIGDAQDFYYQVLKELALFFGEVLDENEEENNIEVVLDITHGINYMPTLTYRALREILGIFAYSFKVRLKVLNAEPYIRQVRPEKLSIHVIENMKILPYLNAYNTDERPIEPREDYKRIGRIIDNFLSQISYNRKNIRFFLSAFIHALPVFVISYMIGTSTLKDWLKSISQKFEEFILVEAKGKIEVRRISKFGTEFANLVKAYLVSFILERLGFSKKTDVPLDDIKNIKRKVFGKLDVESNRIDKEISDIQNLSNIPQNYQSYIQILGGNLSNNIDKRNFFAHAGFEHNVIELRKTTNIELRINNQLKQDAENLLEGALAKI